MSILEHQPNSVLQEIQTSEVDSLRHRLRTIDLYDDEQTGALLLDILSNYASLDTQTLTGTDFNHAERLMLDLFGDCFDEGLLTVEKYNCFYLHNKLNRNSMIIAPKDMDQDLKGIFSSYCSTIPDEELVPVETNRVLLHVHSDTVGINPEGKSGLQTYYDEENDLVYCRGANDMKMSVAMLALVYERFRREGMDFPVLVVTADEESAGSLGGLRLAKCIKSNTLNLDLEPTSCIPGNMVTKLSPSFGIEGFASKLKVDSYFSIKDALGKMFSSQTHPMVTYSEQTLGVSVNNEGFSTSKAELKDCLVSAAGEYIESDRFWLKMNSGKKSSVSKHVQNVVSNVTQKYFPVKETNSKPISVITKGIIEKHGFLGREKRAVLYNNFECMMSLAHPNWGILGPDELGGGRHEKNEAAKVSEGVRIGHAVFDIVKELHAEISQ